MKTTGALQIRLLSGFDDPAFGREQWSALVRTGETPSPYLTWEAQRAWDDVHEGGDLLLVAAERDGEVIAVAPLRVEDDLLIFNGTCFEFDRLDFLGDVSDPEVFFALLDTAWAQASGCSSVYFEFVHAGSPLNEHMPAVAPRLGVHGECFEDMVGLELDLVAESERALAASTSSARQVLKDERWLQRHGRLEVHQLRDTDDILASLPALFDQHRRRRPGPDDESRFHLEEVRRLFERLTERCDGTDLLRFTRLDWDGEPIACHYGFALAGRWFMKAFSMEPKLAKRSPGSILLRHVLLGAIDDGAKTFDFGTGGQDFKRRYATRSWPVAAWELEPESAAGA